MRASEFINSKPVNDTSVNTDAKVDESILVTDVPNDDWLAGKIDYAQRRGKDSFGVPYMGSTTGYVRQPSHVVLPLSLLARIPGARAEQSNVRYEDLKAIMKIMQDTGKLPMHDGREYVPFIAVAWDGSAWVMEGNHRIMAAKHLGWDSLPVELKYFDGGERVESGPLYPEKIGLQSPLPGQAITMNVDEDWKSALATGATAAAMALGGVPKSTPTVSSAQAAIVQPAKTTQQVAPQPKTPQEILTAAAKSAGIAGNELVQLLAQAAHETGNFVHMAEIGDAGYFKKYEPVFKKDKKKKIILDPMTKQPRNFNPMAVRLGNNQPGDGARFKGRGFLQLTGRDNYQRASQDLYKRGIVKSPTALLDNPGLAADPAIAAHVAIWYWNHRVAPKISNFANTRAVTKKINPGMKHQARRQDQFNRMQVAMRETRSHS